MNSNFFLQGSVALKLQLKNEQAKYIAEMEGVADTIKLQFLRERMIALQAQLNRSMKTGKHIGLS